LERNSRPLLPPTVAEEAAPLNATAAARHSTKLARRGDGGDGAVELIDI